MSDKNYYAITVRSVQNGYTVELDFYDNSASDTFRYKEDKYIFGTWEEVIKFVAANTLAFPPKN